MPQDNIKKKNIFKFTKNRFKASCITKSLEYTDYMFAFEDSINIPEKSFINFFTSICCKEYGFVTKILGKLKNCLEDALNDFDGTEIIDGNPKTQRLVQIIRISSPNINLTDAEIVTNVIKLKYSPQKSIQFFIYNNNGILEIHLIDLYHLAVPARHPVTGKEDPKGIYNAKQNAKIPLSVLTNK